MKQENTTEQLVAEIESLRNRVDELKEAEFKRREAEGALKESEARYRSLFAKMINGFTYQKIIVDENNRPVDYLLLEVNESFRMQTEVKYDDIINKKATDIFPGIEKSKFDWIGAFGKVALTGEEIRFEEYLEPLARWYDVFAYSPEKGYFIAIYNEVTGRKQAENDLRQREEQLRHITDKLIESYRKLEKNLVQTVQSLSSLAEMRDPYIAGHQMRVANIACAIASEMGLMKNAIDILRTAALVHDIGKTTIPTEILNKPGSLTGIERVFIQTHAQASYEILKTIEFGSPIAEIVQQHHERLDGSGYPGGLSKSGILFAARILAVADVIEAMASHRPYRPALPMDQAIDEIRHNRGRLYDPEVVDACLGLFETNKFQISSPAHYS